MLFKVSELLERLNEIKNDGYDKVEITVLEAEDELPDCLHFEDHEDEYFSIDYEEVESIEE